MPKYFTYEIKTRVKVNDHAIRGIPNSPGKEGIIIDHLNSWQYDYDVLHDDGTIGRYKEIELNLVHN